MDVKKGKTRRFCLSFVSDEDAEKLRREKDNLRFASNK